MTFHSVPFSLTTVYKTLRISPPRNWHLSSLVSKKILELLLVVSGWGVAVNSEGLVAKIFESYLGNTDGNFNRSEILPLNQTIRVQTILKTHMKC